MIALARHNPEHIYLSGRNAGAAAALQAELGGGDGPDSKSRTTFVSMDMRSVAKVRAALAASFVHKRLDILMCNAGVMAFPPALSADGVEVQFAVNHLAHAAVIEYLLPTLEATAKTGADVRIVSLSSSGWQMHPRGGIVFDKLKTPMESWFFGSWVRYGQTKLANIIYARELARRYPNISTVAIHPGTVMTGLIDHFGSLGIGFAKVLNFFFLGLALVPVEKGALNQLWVAAGCPKDQLRSGSFYNPVGVLKDSSLDSAATNPETQAKLWTWTQETLASIH